MLRLLCFPMRPFPFLVALVLGVTFSHCQQISTTRPQNSHIHRVLTLITQTDPGGSFDGLEDTLAKNFADLPRYENRSQRVDSIASLNTAVAAAAPLDGLILAFHGKPNKLNISPTESILYACLTGEGEDNLAIDLAKTLDHPVIAPTRFWLMQTAVPLAQRVPELTLDREGRLAVAKDEFALYYKRRLESGKDRYLIAPVAMSPLCLSDGFVQRPSRFRPLFQRYSS